MVERVEDLGLRSALGFGRARSARWESWESDLGLAGPRGRSGSQFLQSWPLLNPSWATAIVLVEPALLLPPLTRILDDVLEDGGVECDDQLVLGTGRFALEIGIVDGVHVLSNDVLGGRLARILGKQGDMSNGKGCIARDEQLGIPCALLFDDIHVFLLRL